jgi:hypothetical protein
MMGLHSSEMPNVIWITKTVDRRKMTDDRKSEDVKSEE